MHKSTIVLGLLCVALAVTTAIVSWKLVQEQQDTAIPLAGGSSATLDLPDVRSSRDRAFESRTALLLDADDDALLFEQNGFERRPIASITKLMTAMVAIDHGIDWDTEISITREDYAPGGQLVVHPGETLTIRDAFAASLLGSANNATRAYVRAMDINPDTFIEEMNRKAIALGLEQTTFKDVTGLSPKNVSTAYEVARLADHAFSEYDEIAELTAQNEYAFTYGGTDREHTIDNTNKLISQWGYTSAGSKTGYLHEAGFCLVMAGADNTEGRIGVILAAPNERTKYREMRRLLQLPK